MKTITAIGIFFAFVIGSLAQSTTAVLTFSWEHAMEPNIAGFRLYEKHGTDQVYALVATTGRQLTLDYPMSEVMPCTFVLTAFNNAGLESTKSAEMIFDPFLIFPTPPANAGIVKITVTQITIDHSATNIVTMP